MFLLQLMQNEKMESSFVYCKKTMSKKMIYNIFFNVKPPPFVLPPDGGVTPHPPCIVRLPRVFFLRRLSRRFRVCFFSCLLFWVFDFFAIIVYKYGRKKGNQIAPF